MGNLRNPNEHDKKRNNTSVTESIERGRAAIAEAEGHIHMFEEYLKSSIESKDAFARTTSTSMIHCETMDYYNNLDNIRTNSSLEELEQEPFNPQNDPILSRLTLTMSQSTSGEIMGKTELIDRLMKDGEARMKRDEEISSARVQGNINIPLGIGGYHPKSTALNSNKSTLKRNEKPKFDPNNLSAARRAMVKEAKAADNMNVASTRRQECTNLKARPLPGGARVKNNPYALTKAAIGKMNSVKTTCSDVDTTRIDPLNSGPSHAKTRLDASILLGDDASISSASTVLTNKQCTSKRRKKLKIRNDIYVATTNLVTQEFSSEEEGEPHVSAFEDQDLSGLHQQIARLKAELEIKRKRCSDTIQALEEETQCETINDVGIPELERSFSKSDQSSNEPDTSFSSEISIAGTCSTQPNNKRAGDDLCKKNIYTRHKVWLDNLEQKKKETKEKEDSNEVKNITGRPDLELAKESWSKAKEEHDGLFKSIQEKEKMIQREKLEKDKQKHLIRVKETEKIQALAKEKTKTVKMGIDRRSQNEYADKLSRPNNRVRVERVSKGDTATRATKEPGTGTGKKEDAKNDLIEKEENHTKDNAVSFADMNDKEFAKMIKKIEVLAKKEIRKKLPSLMPSTNVGAMGTNPNAAGGKQTSATSSMSKHSRRTMNANYSPYKSRHK